MFRELERSDQAMAEALQAAQHQPGLVDQAEEILRLRAENKVCRADKAVDRAAIKSLQDENATLKQRLAEVKRQLGLNCSNSTKPPSSDGRRMQSTWGRSGKRSGGQPGQPGTTLYQTDNPDHVEKHVPPQCGGCGAPLSEADGVKYAKRQVFDLPPPSCVEVTEHQTHACLRGACGHLTRTECLDGVRGPTQYGHAGRHDAPGGGSVAGLHRAAAGSDRGREPREAFGRDRLPDRGARAVADVLPHQRAAGQPAGRLAGLLGA